MEVLALDFLAGFNNLQQKIVSKISIIDYSKVAQEGEENE